MKPFLRIAPATLSVESLRDRHSKLVAQQKDLTEECLELEMELFHRTNGEEGLDPRLVEFMKRYQRSSNTLAR